MPSCDADSGNETPVSWNGKKVVVNPTMDAAIGLADIQVISCMLETFYLPAVFAW